MHLRLSNLTVFLAALFVLCSGIADAQEKEPAPPPPAPAAAEQDTLLMRRIAEAVLEVMAAYDRARLDQDVDGFVGLHASNAVQCVARGPDPRLWRIAAFSPIGRPETTDLIRRAFASQNDILTAYSNTVVRVDIAPAAVVVIRRISETYRDRRTGVERRVDGDHSAHFLVKVDGEWKVLTTIAGLGNPEHVQAPPVAPQGR